MSHGMLVDQMSNIYALHQYEKINAPLVLSKSLVSIEMLAELMKSYPDFEPDNNCFYCSITGGYLSQNSEEEYNNTHKDNSAIYK